MKALFTLIVFFLVAFAIVPEAYAKNLKLELVDDIIEVNAGFHGDKLSILGIKNEDQNVLITIQGPQKKITIRKKDKVFGAWVNKSSLNFDQTPSFYRAASNLGNLDDYEDILLNEDILLRSVLDKTKQKSVENKNYQNFEDGLIHNMEQKKLYDAEIQKIIYLDKGFFRWDVYFPANVPTGTYSVKAVLFGDQGVVRNDVKTLNVVRFGSNALVYGFAKDYSFLYGLLCVLIAILAGWGINVVRKRT